MVPSTPAQSDGRLATLLLACGAVAGPLFVATFTREGFRRSEFDQIRLPISELALGEHGWTQRASFLATGVLMLAYAAGLRRALPGAHWAPRFVTGFGVGLIGAGTFSTDPILEPSLDAPNRVGPTRSGLIHIGTSLAAFGSLAAACVAVARRFAAGGDTGWAAYMAISGFLVAAGTGLFGRGFRGVGRLAGLAGLIQRATVVIGWGSLSLLAMRLLRGGPRRSPVAPV